MPLSLEQYADYLDHRGQLWPAPPVVVPARAKPHLPRLPGVRAVLWNVYGTLLAIGDGELTFEHAQPAMQALALDKTLQEFKMWGSMSRKPGQPVEYLKQIYDRVLGEQRLELNVRHAELAADRVWEAILKKLLQKDYTFDAGFYGSLNEFSRKVAYFFHASLQGTACYPGAAEVLRALAERGVVQGLLGDGQIFSPVQLARGLRAQDETADLAGLVSVPLRVLSYAVRVRKPAEALFRSALERLTERGVSADAVLHVGSDLARDLAPAKRLGMRTALFAGDRASLKATPDLLKDPAHRPDVLLTELVQITQVVA